MNSEFELLGIPKLSFKKVRFYTIQYEGAKKSEFKDFTDRMKKLSKTDSRVSEDLDEIRSQIKAIGNKFGASESKFKKEMSAFALALDYPLRNNSDGIFGLRLYCIIISNEIVVLLNGGDKTNKVAQDCDNVSMHFRNANHMDTVIKNYIKDGTLEIIGRDLLNPEEETLYC